MRHKYDVYKEVLDEFKKDSDVKGVLLVGKGAKTAVNQFDTLNDVDLIILTQSGKKNRREAKVIEEIDFDMSYLPISFVESCLLEKNILWIEILASGKIVYSEGIEALIEKSQKIWLEGTPKLRPIQEEYWSFYLTSAKEDIKNRLHDEALANFLIMDFASTVMQLIYKQHQLYIPLKKKRWLDQIKKIEPELALLIEKVLLSKELKERFQFLEELYMKIVGTLGGPCYTWSHEEFPEE